MDTIEASFINDAGEVVTSEPALKFWDEDCNDNGVPDTCDIDCSGFGDMCTEFQSFGRSLDLGDDGIPDECDPCQAAESLKMAALAALEGPDPDLPWAIKMLRTAIGIEEQLRGEAGTRLQLSSAGFWLWRASLLEQIVVKQLRWMQSFDSPRIREMFLRSARQLLDVSLSNLRSGCERL